MIDEKIAAQMSDEVIGKMIEIKVASLKKDYEEGLYKMELKLSEIYESLGDHHEKLADDQQRRRKEKSDY